MQFKRDLKIIFSGTVLILSMLIVFAVYAYMNSSGENVTKTKILEDKTFKMARVFLDESVNIANLKNLINASFQDLYSTEDIVTPTDKLGRQNPFSL
jgi:hypothetical protein